MILFLLLKYVIYIGPALNEVRKEQVRKTLRTYAFRHVPDLPYFFLRRRWWLR